MSRLLNPYIRRREEVLLTGFAKRIYRFIHPDVATLFALLSSITAFILYLCVDGDPSNYLWCCLPIVAHYFWDGVDGKIAVLRQLNRRHGWLIDKISDYICSCFFVAGFFSAAMRNVHVVAMLLGLTTVIHIAYVYCYLKRDMDVKIGGTESRIVLIVLNVLVWIKTLLCTT